MGVYGAYQLPFESLEKLTTIANEITHEIETIEGLLNIQVTPRVIPDNVAALKTYIKEQREYRTQIQNLSIKQAVHRDYTKIDDTIESLNDIYTHNKAKRQEILY